MLPAMIWSPATSAPRRNLALAASLLLTLVGFRCASIGSRTSRMWTDEVSSIETARGPLSQIKQGSGVENVYLPAYFLLLRAVVGDANRDIEFRARVALGAGGGALGAAVDRAGVSLAAAMGHGVAGGAAAGRESAAPLVFPGSAGLCHDAVLRPADAAGLRTGPAVAQAVVVGGLFRFPPWGRSRCTRRRSSSRWPARCGMGGRCGARRGASATWRSMWRRSAWRARR